MSQSAGDRDGRDGRMQPEVVTWNTRSGHDEPASLAAARRREMSGIAATIGTAEREHTRHLTPELIRRLAPLALALAFTVTVALSMAAPPRRTGDAHQYIAMALQLAHFNPPSLSSVEERAYQVWLETQPAELGFPAGASAVRQPTLIRDGRQEFSHFWLYPLLTAPAAAMTSALHLHPLIAFTVTNAAFLGAALLAAARAFGPVAAFALLASPLVWFIGRAQVEVFTVALFCLAIAAAATGRWGWASVAVAVASTQNAPIAVLIPVVWAAGVADWVAERRSRDLRLAPDRVELRRAGAFAAAGVVLALLHPAYYRWRLDVLTPQELNGGIAGAVPAPGRVLAPVLDPDIGFVAWMPVTALLALAGFSMLARAGLRAGTEQRRLALSAIVAFVAGLWFLAVFAQTTNVNSGGTVHLSRYALWLLPLALPALGVAIRSIESRAPGLPLVGCALLFAIYLGYFRADQPERYVEHSPQAIWLMSRFPYAYRPLPEIFVERTLHIDGVPRGSAAAPGCWLILLVAAAPQQPCALEAVERTAAARRFAAGDAAVWVRRATGGESAVTTAITQP